MGTPHRGSDLAWWSSFLANILRVATVSTSTNPKLVTALKNESTGLSDISTQFIERGANLKIYTFYETERFERMNCLVCHISSLRRYQLLTMGVRLSTKTQRGSISQMRRQFRLPLITGRCANSPPPIAKSIQPSGYLFATWSTQSRVERYLPRLNVRHKVNKVT